MSPLTDKRLGKLCDDVGDAYPGETSNPVEANLPDTMQSVKDTGITLDVNREVRIKLYMGWVCYYLPPFVFTQEI